MASAQNATNQHSQELAEPQRAELEQVLAARERQLWMEVRGLLDGLATSPDATGSEVRDLGDSGQRDMNLSQELADLERREHEIGEINAARMRMREGTYGVCEECGEPIPYARLMLRPAARLCVQHEAQWERSVASGRQ